MKRNVKFLVVAFLGIVIAVPLILAYSSETKAYFFSRDLQVTDFVAIGSNAFVANVSDSGSVIADLYFQIEPLEANSTMHVITFQIAHFLDSQLDSMILRFAVEPVGPPIYLEASSYNWARTQFTTDNGDILYSVPDMGWYGGGSILLRFLMDSSGHSFNLGFTISLAMHTNTFLQLTSLKANAHLSINLV